MRRRIASTSAVLAAAAAVALAGCAATDAGSSHDGHGADPGAQPSVESSSGASPADVMFAAMMIPHHEQAVEMADIVLAKPDLDARVADLATRIRDAQAPEIATMEGWLAAWGEDADAHAGMQHGDDGMLSDDELADLEAADGAEASRLFLEGMIAHHEGAVTMAEQQLADGSDPDALALAESIVATQQAEIDEMRALLDEL
ncbi:DUF305 domain-containing protein [Agrococcus jejuensis]|uniref:Uncharacterized conserved protein, DUF305 family n=1 Tax=Agrococcus jejuensis TaxID=399736 RepID=A0A1G8H2H2_9MICO|nr:DUF305 domain-containing protein [Agrococcus jejuensis]SDI00872.1 Uncharacterized conserved protein, DUF305 family [Agrococcus jejuensis]